MKRFRFLAVGLSIVASQAAVASGSMNDFPLKALPVLVNVDANGKITDASPAMQLPPAVQRILLTNLDEMVTGPAHLEGGKPISSQCIINVYLKATPRPDGKFDAGFAFDGDGDRIGAMDPDGTFITPHQIFSILFWHLAGTRKLGGDVAKTFSTTKMIDKIAAKYGRKVFETPIGFKYICDRMLENDILLGGEESGGIGTKLYLPERDATVNALLLAEVMAWHGKSLNQLVAMLHREFGEHHYGRVDLELKAGQKEKAIEYFSNGKLKRVLEWSVARRENLDGIKAYLGDVGWVMVRASGTERMLRVYSETIRPETTRRVLEEVVTIVRGL